MLRDRLLALVLRPTAPPAIWGVATAAVLIAFEVLLVHLLKRVAPDNAFGAVFLLGVLVVSAGGASASRWRPHWPAPWPMCGSMS